MTSGRESDHHCDTRLRHIAITTAYPGFVILEFLRTQTPISAPDVELFTANAIAASFFGILLLFMTEELFESC
jgi:hypothetical protein